VPFGLDSGPRSGQVLPIEWVFAGLCGLAALCLLARLFGWLRPTGDSWALGFSAGTWILVACYAGFFLPSAVWRWRLGIGVVCTGIAMLNSLFYVRESFGVLPE
jgi:hypothetical protein